MTTLYENYITGDDVDFYLFSSSFIEGQTFTPSISHTITSVKLKLWRDVQATGTLTIAIRATDGTGKPTGANLCSGTLAISGVTTSSPGLWYEITLGAGTILTAGIKYVILIYSSDFGPDGTFYIRYDTTSPTYSGGNEVYSINSGSSWNVNTGRDVVFEEWGTPIEFKPPRTSFRLITGGNGSGPYDTPPGVQGTDWEWTGGNIVITTKKLVAVAANKLWFESP